MSNHTDRLRMIDTVRGLTILSMMGFHAFWDLFYFGMGVSYQMLTSKPAYIWQQSICWTFILLSGFCFSMGHHHIKRGLMSLGGGIIISIVTQIIMPEERDLFGVLWMLGACTLIWILPDKLFAKIRNKALNALLLLLSGGLFFIFRNINSGYFGFEGLNLAPINSNLYKGYLMTFLGFTDPTFYSSDYFSLFPWIFLFTLGYFLNKMLKDTRFESRVLSKGVRPLEFLGRHSFIIYMLHQVVIYGIIYLIYLLWA